MPSAGRPYVICHMLPSIDGRIVLRDWKVPNATREYERIAATFEADGWVIGRISMEPYAGKVAEHEASSYAIAIDPSGKLTWKASDNTRRPSRSLKLTSIEKRPGGIVWLRYKVRR